TRSTAIVVSSRHLSHNGRAVASIWNGQWPYPALGARGATGMAALSITLANRLSRMIRKGSAHSSNVRRRWRCNVRLEQQKEKRSCLIISIITNTARISQADRCGIIISGKNSRTAGTRFWDTCLIGMVLSRDHWIVSPAQRRLARQISISLLIPIRKRKRRLLMFSSTRKSKRSLGGCMAAACLSYWEMMREMLNLYILISLLGVSVSALMKTTT